ncbi:DUF4259 domain-containing protein [Corynebacterium massiliense]|mgnify:CR=1 FL=1|uniref:DUF4259 domain-containing protein n=1 Tax=Corynebacterium massiliense DSM 45435 TaxID=1121364 RepID=A0ABY7U8M3_9CORY|nr:DUF4259 domain-containing protein [Corynebacterium massiliense]WCZ32430.1 hypothetical protein CMASS_04920 [Corynebacterium massiliense DSM 45435]
MGTWGVGPFDNHRAREIVDAVRTGTFDFDVFRETCADDDLDADEAEAIIALGALATAPQEDLPPGIAAARMRCLFTDNRRLWLRHRIEKAIDPDNSTIYALWEATGELDNWVKTARAVLP